MPSPFPGMDPFLEGELWTTLHFNWASEIVRQLAPRLRPRYLALPEKRYVLSVPEDVAISAASLRPDVPEAIPHVTIEIRDVAQRQLVTAIEVLSPTNKRGEGRAEYLTRRRRILMSNAHLIEIDLLREGERVPMQQPLPAAPYFVFVGRAEFRPMLDVWPVQLTDPLPVIPIPLLPGDSDVPLDLQTAFTTIYDLQGYDLAVDYRQPPEPPLPSAQEVWADALLRTAGLRP